MPVETATYISDLVITNPLHTDGIAQADSHLRLIKSVIKSTFPNVTGAVTLTNTELNGMGVPIGAILIWSGAANAIPSGYHLCDGTTGTPNLTDRFVIGAGAGYAVAGTGGATTNTVFTAVDGAHTHTGATSAAGAHDHGVSHAIHLGASGTASSLATSSATSTATPTGTVSGTVAGHALSVAELPAHDHGIGGSAVFVSGLTWGFQNVDPNVYIGTAVVTGTSQGSGVAHDHTWSGSLSLSTSVSTSVTTSVTTSLSALPVSGTIDTQLTMSADHTHGISTTDSTHYHTVTVPVLPPYYALCYIQRIS